MPAAQISVSVRGFRKQNAKTKVQEQDVYSNRIETKRYCTSGHHQARKALYIQQRLKYTHMYIINENNGNL